MPSDGHSGIRRARSILIGDRTVGLDRPLIMGIINATPDSFSGDGIHDDAEEAIRTGMRMIEQGAYLLDVGGESTRPNAQAIPASEELDRIGPVLERLSAEYPGRISVDTMKPEVADRAFEKGATMINDVSGFTDERMIDVAVRRKATVIVMHMQGTPRTMQVAPAYGDVVSEISEFLRDRVKALEEAGVDPRRIMVDPGIGFGKDLSHNLEILARLDELRAVGKPVVVGVSRKSFIGKISGLPPQQRLGGSISAALAAARAGADVLRVHDVLDTATALKVMHAIDDARASTREK